TAVAEPAPTDDPQPGASDDPQACRAALADAAAAQASLGEAQAALGSTNTAGLALLHGTVEALGSAVAALQAWASGVAELATTLAAAPPQVITIPAAPTQPVVDSPLTPTTGSSETPVVQRSPIVAAEVALAKARRDLAKAQQDLADATMVAPVDGVLSALPFTVGSTANPSARAIITSPGGIRVTTTVPASAFAFVHSGQQATLRGSGGAEALASVFSKNLVPASSGGYPVTVIASGDAVQGFASGTSATVEIEVSSATDAIVVPLTAVRRDGQQGTVRVLAGSEVIDVPVELGSIGDTRIEVRSGVEVGDRLVVADAEQPLPSLNW
ncbi:MAG: hypothetical protein L0G22_08490, partial [Propionibacteriaceae bacterium]|nr:hypothetical protein [Propionibacteriaceae bacterium]